MNSEADENISEENECVHRKKKYLVACPIKKKYCSIE